MVTTRSCSFCYTHCTFIMNDLSICYLSPKRCTLLRDRLSPNRLRVERLSPEWSTRSPAVALAVYHQSCVSHKPPQTVFRTVAAISVIGVGDQSSPFPLRSVYSAPSALSPVFIIILISSIAYSIHFPKSARSLQSTLSSGVWVFVGALNVKWKHSNMDLCLSQQVILNRLQQKS